MSAARHIALLAWLLLAVPAEAAAQLGEGGSLELGAFATRAQFDQDALRLSNDFGSGLRLAWHPTRLLAVELGGSRIPTFDTGSGDPVDVDQVSASLIASVRAWRSNTLFAGLGFSRVMYGGGAGFDDNAVHVVIGDRVPLSRMAALRIDLRGVYAWSSGSPAAADEGVLTFASDIGISVFWFERAPRDGDGDLIPDPIDACPGTPIGAHVDQRGCPRDGDGDRVPNGLDRCPGSRAGESVDEVGCSADQDDDGVPDSVDRCPATAAGVSVDESGCEIRHDSDGDLVFDDVDRCPGTTVGMNVDAIGCPLLFEEVAGETRPLVLRGVTFAFDQASLTPESHAVLDDVAASLLVHADVRIEIAGHTDNVGTAERNLTLSRERAEAVRAYLMARGVSGERMSARGLGQTEPVSSNTTEEGRARNRRVELHLIE